jgi:hypothetical protein
MILPFYDTSPGVGGWRLKKANSEARRDDMPYKGDVMRILRVSGVDFAMGY